jgi:hypothetical protein
MFAFTLHWLVLDVRNDLKYTGVGEQEEGGDGEVGQCKVSCG